MPSAGRTYFNTLPYADPEGFFHVNLVGGSIDFDVNLSNRNCGCVTAFYMVKSPGKDQMGNLWNTEDGFWYCDGNAS